MTTKAPRPWSRVALATAMFLPAPLAAAFPAHTLVLTQEWAGIPVAALIIPVYILAIILLAVSFSSFSARMES